ncbi:MAG: tetratricopeptide repeat protein [Bacteroidetes bacterium]|nr:tetratricopeptide repeat protein [Bacteroidota bacterium]
MTRKAPFFFFYLLLCAVGWGQDTPDSLDKLLSAHPGRDTVRLKLLNAAAFDAYFTDPEKGVKYANEAIGLARALNTGTGLSVALRTRGLNYYSLGKDSLALEAYGESLKQARSAGDSQSVGKTLHAMGLIYNGRSVYDSAIDYHTQALRIFKQIKDENSAANAANSLGINYLYLGDFPRAIESYQQALDIYTAGRNKKGVGQVYTNMGIVYRRMLDFRKAIEYDKKALDIYSLSAEDLLPRANVLANLANIYDDMGDGQRALSFYDSAMAICESIRNSRGIASNSLNKGIVYNGLGEYDSAFLYLNKGLGLYRQLGDKNSMSIALSELGKAVLHAPEKILVKRGMNPGKRRETANRLNREALRLAEEIEAIENQRDVWEILARTYEEQGNAAGALDAYKHYLVLKDSILNDSTKQRITRLTMQYEQEKKAAQQEAGFEKRQAVAAAELSRQRWLTGLVAVVLVLFAGTSLAIFLLYKRRQEAKRRYEKAELEMKALRSQMNPHFIFNSLNSVRDYMVRHRTEEAGEYLGRFAGLMRLILENSERKEVPISDDIAAMKLYVELESMRLHNSFRYRITVDESIDTDSTYIPPLILQPFIENSIWHGLAGKKGGGELVVGIHKINDMLCCVVEDNGQGRKASGNGERKSYGTKITAERIGMFNNASMKVIDLEQGTRVEIWLPLMIA